MSYSSSADMARSQGLVARVTAAAGEQGAQYPQQWAMEHIWTITTHSDWVSAWEYAKATETINQNPDTGARNDVITDGMILAAVQAQIAVTPQ